MSAKNRARARAHGRGKNLRRSGGSRPERRTFRIYVEGRATEPEYIAALKRLPAIARDTGIDIQIMGRGKTPRTLMDRAVEDRHRSDLDIDSYWCVFDVESPVHHPHLGSVREDARRHGISLAISNPCFELWLILHLQDQSASLTTAAAVRTWQDLNGAQGKHIAITGTGLVESRAKASDRARRLRRKHSGDGTRFPEDNPSSSFDLLLSAIEATGPSGD